MVKLIVGTKGTGKTKKMIEMANEQVSSAKGSLIFINKDQRLMYDLKHDIRFISTEDFDIEDISGYIGFLYGIICSDHDIETIYVDSIIKHAKIEFNDVVVFLERLEAFSDQFDVEFRVSISSSLEDLPKEVEKFNIIN